MTCAIQFCNIPAQNPPFLLVSMRIAERGGFHLFLCVHVGLTLFHCLSMSLSMSVFLLLLGMYSHDVVQEDLHGHGACSVCRGLCKLPQFPLPILAAKQSKWQHVVEGFHTRKTAVKGRERNECTHTIYFEIR